MVAISISSDTIKAMAVKLNSKQKSASIMNTRVPVCGVMHIILCAKPTIKVMQGITIKNGRQMFLTLLLQWHPTAKNLP